MKKVIKKVALTCLLCCAFAVGVGTAVSTSTFAEVKAVEIVSGELKNSYGLGTTLVMPESVSGTYNGSQTTFSNGILIFPDGTAHTGSQIPLTEVGRYIARYSVATESGTLRAEKEFDVKQKNWTLSSTDSSAEYKTKLETKVYQNNKQFAQGLAVSLASGDTFTWNKPLDLSDSTLEEIIRINPLLGEDYGQINGSTYINEPVAAYCDVFLTDCYDPNVYVKLHMMFEKGKGIPYFRVGSSNQEEIGLDGPKGEAVVSNKSKREVWVDGQRYCGWLETTTSGTWLEVGYPRPESAGYGWYLDYETQRWTATNQTAPKLVNVLNEKGIYGENLFEGFTTGEVYLSVKCGEYYSSKPARIEIVSIGHERGDALKEADMKDTKKPVIVLNEKISSFETVYCALGEKFILPVAQAFDAGLVDTAKAKVYKNYGKADQAEVLVENGSFIPNALTTYTIEYSAKDASGNVGKKILQVRAIKVEGGKSISFKTDKLESISAGEETTLPAYSLVGYNGETKIKISVRYGDETQEIDLNKMSFTPLHIGEYTITYEYSDAFYSYVDEYTVNSVASDALVMIDEPIMPRYFIKGETYSLDEYFIYSFTQKDPTPLETQVSVSFDGGATFTKVEDTKAFEIAGTGTAILRYSYEGIDVYQTKAVPIVDVEGTYTEKGKEYEGIWLYKYFVGDFKISDVEQADMRFDTVNETGTQTLSFISPLSASNFRLTFSIPEGRDNFSVMKIVLTDYYDPQNQTVIAYEKSGNNVNFSIDGGEKLVLKDPFASTVSKTIYYDAGNSVLRHPEGSGLYVYDFQSDKCYLDVIFKDCTGASSIVVKQVGNNAMKNTVHEDKVAPTISVQKNNGNKLLNSEIAIFKAEMLDVLSSVLYKNITVSVVDPDGNDVESVDGVKLSKRKPANATRDYEIKLTKLGTYKVSYEGKDNNNKGVELNYNINVYKNQAPVITFDKGYTETTLLKMKLGEAISLPKYTVKDDSPLEELTITVALLCETDGVVYPFENGVEKVWVRGKGYYRMYVNVADADDNFTNAYYRILVQ